MVTLLTVGDSGGSRRCDAHCHDAKEPDCDCVCGGRYHGKGVEHARSRIQQDIRDGRFGKGVRATTEAFMEQCALF